MYRGSRPLLDFHLESCVDEYAGSFWGKRKPSFAGGCAGGKPYCQAPAAFGSQHLLWLYYSVGVIVNHGHYPGY